MEHYLDPFEERLHLAFVLRIDAGGQSVLGAVGQLKRFVREGAGEKDAPLIEVVSRKAV